MSEHRVGFRLSRGRSGLAGAVVVMLCGAVAYAAGVVWPADHSGGKPLSASDVDGYLNNLDGRGWQGTSTTRYFSGGNVGIGTATPTQLLDVESSTASVILTAKSTGSGVNGAAVLSLGRGGTAASSQISLVTAATVDWGLGTSQGSAGLSDFSIYSYGNASNTLTIQKSNGYVGIGTVSPSYPLDVNGTIRGGNVSPSDVRLKSDVHTLEGALDSVERLRGVRFKWKKDGARSIGVIAQELEAVYPELVSTAADGIKSVDYGKLSGVLIEATKSLRAENQAIRAENAELRSRLDRIEARLDRRATR